MTYLRAPLRSVWWDGCITGAIVVAGLALGIIAVCIWEVAR